MKISEIVIKDCFKETYPRKAKMEAKKKYLKIHNKYKDEIIIDENNYLEDGYITYILCHFNDIIPKCYKRIGKRFYEIKLEF